MVKELLDAPQPKPGRIGSFPYKKYGPARDRMRTQCVHVSPFSAFPVIQECPFYAGLRSFFLYLVVKVTFRA